VGRGIVAIIALVCMLAASAGCRKRREFRDAAPRPPAGTLRGSFALTYYWLGPDQPGVGVKDDPLVRFVSIAVDPRVIPLGTKLYVQELDGLELPYLGEKTGSNLHGELHDGCVVAQDTGAKIKDLKIDWFVEQKAYYQFLDRRHALTHVTIHEGGARCP
jgi:3D (Asp-Asp-Asp) domain-containing protein